MSKTLWYPYSAMTTHGLKSPPLEIVSAEGSHLIAKDGRRYIDGIGSWWVSSLGHQHPRLIQALKSQADQMCHVALAGITHEPAEQLADALVEITPANLDRVFFSDNGSTAIEVAARIALQYFVQTGQANKKQFMTLSHAFHGDTVASASFSDMPEFHQHMQSICFESIRIPSPADGEEASLHAVRQSLEERGQSIAAMIIEPLIQGAGGMQMYSADYLKQLVNLLKSHDVLLISDEIFVGYGRTGKMWAMDHAEVSPDIMCVSKGFTGGLLPMAATLSSEVVFQAFVDRDDGYDRTLRYGHTFCANPLGAAVALEVIDVFRDEKVLAQLEPRMLLLEQAMQRMLMLSNVKKVRRCGMVAAIELEPEKQSGYLDQVGWKVAHELLSLGVYLRPLGNVLYFVPALNMPLVVLQEMLEKTELVLNKQRIN
ncbi:MAG: adenosylmethionine--8-amino-7-oxononanoate transaminase [Mariprofundaceae bacterium]|nr:adenosylmethionine--8-amino-7-oxononanoate transaminase [Mariprofundaceae bacterium]